MQKVSRRSVLGSLLAVPFAAARPAMAQAWPARPIKLVVTFAAGGGADFVGRAIGNRLTESLGQSVIVDNRAGGGGLIGNEVVVRAPPDGYTLLLGAAGPLTVAPHLYKNVAYDTFKDLMPVAMVGSTPFVLVVNPSVQANTLAELTALARNKPGKLNYGSSGTGGAPHLAGELYTAMAGISMVHAPYKGLAPAITDLLGGHIQVLFADTGLVQPYIKAGKLRALALTGGQRSALVPEVPTMKEAGLPGYQAGSWYGILAPAGTPAAIVNRVGGAVQAALKQPELQKQLVAQGVEPVSTTAEQFGVVLREDYNKWGKLIKDANIKLE
jgi:tripartite-type tricarboxylate transporter receptor subunit TctC